MNIYWMLRIIELKAIISDIRPYGQTNTGDGLRMGEFLLQQGDTVMQIRR